MLISAIRPENLLYTFTRTGTTSGSLTVNFTVGGTGTFNTDYTQGGAATFSGTSGTVVIPDGSSMAVVTIDPTADTTVEPDETVVLTVAVGTGYTVGSPGSQTGTILNDDTSNITINDVTLAEGSPSGTTAFTFTVSLSKPVASDVTVDYATANDTATTADNDYTAASGTLTFTAGGALTQTVTVNVTKDINVELGETFYVNLSNAKFGAATDATRATITDSQGLGMILNDDVALGITATDASKAEGNTGSTPSTPFTFTVSRTGLTTGATTVNYAVTGSGANPANAADFSGGMLPSGVVNFAAGETSKPLTINVNGDLVVEPDEGFTVTLSGASGNAQITTPTATGTIINDDQTETVTVAVSPSSVLEDGTPKLSYTFTRTGGTSGAIAVNFTTSGLADDLSDYTLTGATTYNTTSNTGTVTIPDGNATATVIVDPTPDTNVEPDKTVILGVASGTGYTAGSPSSATGTILNDDGWPNLTPFQPSGWSDKIVVSNVTGTNTDSSPLYSTDTLYVDWAALNNGTAGTGYYRTALYVDGTKKAEWYTLALGTGSYDYRTDYNIGTLAAGSHKIQITADWTGIINESNESDNTYTKNITVVPGPWQIIDDGDSGFSTAGQPWYMGTGEGFGGDLHFAAKGTGDRVAAWTFSVLPGQYRVAATWTTYTNRATNSQYTVYDDTTLQDTIEANQQAAPKDFTLNGTPWEYLDYVNVSSNTLVVKLSNKANGYVIADAVRIERAGDAGPLPIQIVDSGASGYSAAGGWSSVTGDGYLSDLDYCYKAGSGVTPDEATWTFTVEPGASYRVSTTWSPYKNRASNAPYTIYDGTTALQTVEINQRVAPEADVFEHTLNWEDLGVFPVTGSSLVVKLTNAANKYVIADAVRIEKVAAAPTPQFCDSSDAAFVAKGSWDSWLQGYLASDVGSIAGTGSNVARWAFSDLAPGQYQVWATWVADPNRATNAPYTIYDGSTVVGSAAVDQTKAPGPLVDHSTGWTSLGTFTFSTNSLIVRLSNNATGYVIADAIRIEPVWTLTVDAAAAPVGNAAVITPQQLASITDEAIRRMTAAVGSQAAAKLAGVTFKITDLPPGILGEEAADTVWIDGDGAGYGWFVDPTPRMDEEFSHPVGGQESAFDGSPAASRADLLTAVMHELGHELGYGHNAGQDLMNATLPLGTRRLFDT